MQRSIEAKGGAPFVGKRRPKSGRYWEFADYTLVDELLQDNVHFGKDGMAIPHPKKHLPPGGVEFVNQQTWWPARDLKNGDNQETEGEGGFGYTQDATKHLKKLAELKLISESVTTAKPERLMERFVKLFTRPNDIVLELFGEAADLSAVAMKTGRRFIFLSGNSDHEKRLARSCSVPRLDAVLRGKDRQLEEMRGEIDCPKDSYIPYDGGGSFWHLSLEEPLAEVRFGEDFPTLNQDWVRKPFDQLRDAILSADGHLPLISKEGIHGETLDGIGAAIVLMPQEFLDQSRVAEICSSIPDRYQRLIVYYFRSAEDFDSERASRKVVFKRVPMDLTP
jgi:hypothetical protein